MDQFNAQLEATLQGAIQGDSESIKAATSKLHADFYTKPEAVVGLMEILQKHPNASIRQLAGVELKKIILWYWGGVEDGEELKAQLSEGQKTEVKQQLLRALTSESTDIVRHTIARVIAVVASRDVDDNKYPELLPAIAELCQSSEARNREVGTYLVYAILEATISDTFINSAKDVMGLLSNGLKDPESLQVRVSSVLALGSLYISLDDPSQKEFEKLIPSFIEVLAQCIQSDDEKGASDIFVVLNDLNFPEACPLNAYYGDIIQHMLTQYAVDVNLDDDMRNAALNFVSNVSRYRAKRIQQLKLGVSIVKVCIEILAQPADDDDEDDDDDTDTPARIALRLLANLSESLPPKQVIAPIIDSLPQLVNSGNPHQAFAGFMAFAATLEGAPDYADQHMDVVLPLVVRCLTADVNLVKIAAFRTLVVLAAELPLTVGAEHAVLLPLVFQILDNADSIKTARISCHALVRILEILDRDTITEKYLDAVVVKLMSLVGNIDDLELKGIVVECIGGAALSAGKNFMPYFQQTVQVIEKFIGVPTSDKPSTGEIKLAGMSLETLSTLCSAVGAEPFRPYLTASMTAAFNYLESGITELREDALIMISVSAKVFKEEFVPYMEKTMETVFAICDRHEFPALEEETVGIDDEDFLSDGALKVNSDVAVEKEYACDLIREILTNIPPSHFNKYLEQTFEVMMDLSGHFYNEIRREVAVTIWKLFSAYISLEITPGQWSPGFPSKVELSQVNQTIAEKVIDLSTSMLSEDDEAPVLSALFDCITTAIRESGPIVLGGQESLETLMSTIILILQKQHPCQLTGYDPEDEPVNDEGEISEGAVALIDNSVDCLSQIVACFGAGFPLFSVVAAALLPYVQSKNPSERQTGVSALAEVMRNMQGNLPEHENTLMEVFVHGLSDKKLGVRSVSAWGAGLMYDFSSSDELLKASYPTILSKLQNLLKKVDKAEKKRVEADEEELHNDNLSLANACGCVARISQRYPDLIPLDQILPVLFSRLPLASAGYEEYTPIFKFIWSLVENKNPLISQHGDELVRILNSVIETYVATKKSNALKGVYEVDSPSPLDEQEALVAVRAIVAFFAEHNPEVIRNNPTLQTDLS